MPLSRKTFLATTAFAASAGLAMGPASADDSDMRSMVHFHVLKESEYNHAQMMKVINATTPHKQVFQSVSPIVVAPGIASVYIHMQNALNAYEYSLGYGKGTLGTLAVFIGPSIVFGLNDKMWEKYKIGSVLNLASRNIYYRATSKLDPDVSPDDPTGMYQDWSAQAVLARGGAFMVCHNATTAVAGMIGMKSGSDPKAVLADFKANMLPGFQLVPAGVATVQLAQENGWKVYPII